MDPARNTTLMANNMMMRGCDPDSISHSHSDSDSDSDAQDTSEWLVGHKKR